MSTNTSNMNLVLPTIAVDSGLAWEQAMNANSAIIDQHNHSLGSGAQIGSGGVVVDSDFAFNNNNAISLQSVRFQQQTVALAGAEDLSCLYSTTGAGNLYYNDGAGNQIQITSGGLVNATASGISSGTATASFVGSVLVVNAASNTPANVQCASVLIGNTGVSGSKFVTLNPQPAMGSNYSLTLPSVQAATGFMVLDTSGNMGAPIPVTAGLAGSNMANNINLPGKYVEAGGLAVVVSNTNPATNGLAIVRGAFTMSGTNPVNITGEGFSVTRTGTGTYTVAYTTAFNDSPAVTTTLYNGSGASSKALAYTGASSGFTLYCTDAATGAAADLPNGTGASFIAIGMRA